MRCRCLGQQDAATEMLLRHRGSQVHRKRQNLSLVHHTPAINPNVAHLPREWTALHLFRVQALNQLKCESGSNTEGVYPRNGWGREERREISSGRKLKELKKRTWGRNILLQECIGTETYTATVLCHDVTMLWQCKNPHALCTAFHLSAVRVNELAQGIKDRWSLPNLKQIKKKPWAHASK